MRVNKDLSNPDINYNKRWSIVNRVCDRENSSSIPLMVQDEVPIFDSEGKKGIFNKHFVLQSKLPVANAIPSVIQPHQTQIFFLIRSASEEQVLELMKGVDISEA